MLYALNLRTLSFSLKMLKVSEEVRKQGSRKKGSKSRTRVRPAPYFAHGEVIPRHEVGGIALSGFDEVSQCLAPHHRKLGRLRASRHHDDKNDSCKRKRKRPLPDGVRGRLLMTWCVLRNTDLYDLGVWVNTTSRGSVN